MYISEFFIFRKLTKLCHFVTYLWDDPRTYAVYVNTRSVYTLLHVILLVWKRHKCPL